MSKNKLLEINVKKTAAMLNVTDRSVLNFIKLKKIDAIKVGKEWFIDYASLLSFAQRYNYKINDDDTEISEKDSENTENAEIISANAQIFPKVSETSEISAKNEKVFPNIPKDNLKVSKYDIHQFRVFLISKQIFNKKLHGINKKDAHVFEARLADNVLNIFQYISSGYYAFGFKQKLMQYQQARDNINGLIGLLSCSEQVEKDWQQEIADIKNNLKPALTALIKKIETTHLVNKS